MISSVKLKSGRSEGQPSEPILISPITVFVGPNNSGKSKVLTELEFYCRNGHFLADTVILDNVEFLGIDESKLNETIALIQQNPNLGESLNADHIFVGSKQGRQQVPLNSLTFSLINPASNLNIFCTWFLRHSTLSLDGRSRINLVDSQTAGDLQSAPQNSLQVLFHNDSKREEVRRIVKDAFGSYFVIDPTNIGQFRIRLSNRQPANSAEERNWDSTAVKFHSEAQQIEKTSDGVKAFTGIITELIAGDPKIVLMDEPEAFLHPPLATKLGNEVAQAALAADKRVFVSTHSPMFVMGCIQSGAPVNIVRLTYRDGVATSRVLPSQEILELMRNPLLRSTGVLSGLFYEFVIITESDADRAFYQEINERLLRFKPEWGIPNCLFINAQNKQTIHTIMKPLRKLGIPSAGIVDIDILKEGGTTWTNLLTGANIPLISHSTMGTNRAAIKLAMDKTGKDMKRDGGISILPKSEKEAAENLLNQLEEYGVFTVPGGELECWLKGLGAKAHGPSWLIDIFERMGEDTESSSFIRPSDNDVWKFMSSLRNWLTNPRKRGIPD